MLQMLKRVFTRARPSPQIKEPERFQAFFDAVEARSQYTPDLPELFRRQWWWLFVPDEMQRGHHKNELIRECEPYENDVAYTQGKFMLLRHDLGKRSTALAFATDLNYQNGPALLPIKGELVRAHPGLFVDLDKYKLNGVSCYRNLVSVVVPYEGLLFKDRGIAGNVLGKESKPNAKVVTHYLKKRFTRAEAEAMARDIIINSSYVKKPGVLRSMAWMYIADPNYWEDTISLTNNHPLVRSFDNEKGLIKKYYRFTKNEYDPPDPPWV